MSNENISTPYDKYLDHESNLVRLLFIITMLTISPVIEEFLYRYIVIELSLLIFQDQVIAVSISVLIFVGVHFYQDLKDGSGWFLLIHTILGILIAAVLAYVYLTFGFWQAVIYHSGYNLLCLAIVYIGGQ